MALVTLRRYRDPVDAHVDRAALEGAGIPAFVADDQLIAMQWLYSYALGGVKLQVAPEDVASAQALLESDEEVAPSELSESSTTPSDGDVCPVCHSTKVRQSPWLRRSLAISLIVNLPIFVWRRRWVCEECGYSWRMARRSVFELPAETREAEETVHQKAGSYPLLVGILLSWLGACLIYYVLRNS